MGPRNYKWEYSVIDAYEPLISVKGWMKCRGCGEFPRVWQYNNGNNAKCCCTYKYDGAEAKAESVMSWAMRHNGSCLGYHGLEFLRQSWNTYVMTGIPQTYLPEGLW